MYWKNYTPHLILLMTCISLFSCRKSEQVLVPGNTVPYYEGITTVQIQNYVNKAYIDITGEEPSLSERDNWVSTLKNEGLDSAARVNFISSLQNTVQFRNQFDNVYVAPMLGANFDSLAMEDVIDQLQFFRSIAISNGDSIISQYWGYEINKMSEVQTASSSYHSGQISINEFKRRLANNYIYDQINMGAENFVIACFENFFKRLPTEQEEAASELMVEGTASRVLLQDGTTKGDYLDIMVNATGFYEGLIIDSYLHLLSRRPTSAEMGPLSIELENGQTTIKELQYRICRNEEYAGF